MSDQGMENQWVSWFPRTETWCHSLHQYHPNNLDVFVFVQGILMAHAVGIQCPGTILPTGEERSAGNTNGTSNSQAPVTQHSASGSASLQGNIQHIADRLHTLHELHENRNQVYFPKIIKSHLLHMCLGRGLLFILIIWKKRSCRMMSLSFSSLLSSSSSSLSLFSSSA